MPRRPAPTAGIVRLRWNKGRPLVLSTERFVLRSVSQRWIARNTLPWTENKDVMAGLELRAGGWLLRRWRRQFAASDNQDNLILAILDKRNNRLLGYENVKVTDGRVAFIAVTVGDTDWWGKGLVLETRAALLDYLFDVRGCMRVWGMPYGRNFASIYNYQRLGFLKEGVLRKSGRSANGEGSDMIAFGMLADEWRAKRAQTQS